MKPIYILLVMWSLFITGLCGGISFALVAIPGIGIVLALVVTFCINATMGMGLLYALISNDMYHPKFGPPLIIGGFIPGFDLLPFWLGLVIAGIAHDMSKEKGLLGDAAAVVVAVQSGKSPLSTAHAVADIAINERRATGRPPQAANDNEPQEEAREQKSHAPLNLVSPKNMNGMNGDIAPPRASNNNFPYAKAA